MTPTRRPLVALGILTAASAMALTACTSGSSGAGSQASNGSSSAGTPVAGGTLRLGIISSPQKLDPIEGTSFAEGIIGNNISDKLVWQDPSTGKIEPWLATSFRYNAALTSFTFTLRKGVTFSNGTPFNAQVVKDNIDQRALGSTSLGLAADVGHFPNYAGTTVVDPSTVTVNFKQPNAGFLNIAGFEGDNPEGFVAESTLKLTAEQRAADVTKIVSTGPFVLKSFTYQKSVVLTRRAGYHWAPAAIAHTGSGGAAYLKQIDIETIPEASVRTGSLESGDLDAISDVQPTDEATLKAAGFPVLSGRIAGVDLGFGENVGLAPTNDPAVRQALIIGWNRNDLSKSVLSSSYKPATSVLGSKTPGYVDYSQTALKYDPAKAERILDAAGWKVGSDGIREKDGKKLIVKLLVPSDLLAPNVASAELFQAELKKVGIDVKLSEETLSDILAKYSAIPTTYNGVLFNTSRQDPSVLGQSLDPKGGNSANIPKGDPLAPTLGAVFTKINSTLDTTTRNAATKQAQDLILSKNFLYDPFYEVAQVVATSPKVHGWLFGSLARSYYYNVWFGK